MTEEADDLFSYARSTDPHTSHAAAREADTQRLQGLVLDALLSYGPLNTSEIAARVNIPRDSLSPRMKPLRAAGLIIDSGARRDGPSGKSQIVWRLTLPMEQVRHTAPLTSRERLHRLEARVEHALSIIRASDRALYSFTHAYEVLASIEHALVGDDIPGAPR